MSSLGLLQQIQFYGIIVFFHFLLQRLLSVAHDFTDIGISVRGSDLDIAARHQLTQRCIGIFTVISQELFISFMTDLRFPLAGTRDRYRPLQLFFAMP